MHAALTCQGGITHCEYFPNFLLLNLLNKVKYIKSDKPIPMNLNDQFVSWSNVIALLFCPDQVNIG